MIRYPGFSFVGFVAGVLLAIMSAPEWVTAASPGSIAGPFGPGGSGAGGRGFGDCPRRRGSSCRIIIR